MTFVAGQVDLDSASQVRHPGGLAYQTVAVMAYIDRVSAWEPTSAIRIYRPDHQNRSKSRSRFQIDCAAGAQAVQFRSGNKYR
jgi:hypothetical protein